MIVRNLLTAPLLVYMKNALSSKLHYKDFLFIPVVIFLRSNQFMVQLLPSENLEIFWHLAK